jgi:hypothetical protein
MNGVLTIADTELVTALRELADLTMDYQWMDEPVA